LIRKSLATEPGSASYLDSLAWALYKQGKYEQAYHYAMMAYRGMDEKDPVVLDHMGDICLKLRKFKEAKTFWQESIRACRDRDPFTLEPGLPGRCIQKIKQLRAP
jgi:tetratricopeptide (TPR) repeat protein